MAEGDQLNQFLSKCLKQEKHVKIAQDKLEEEGIDYDTMYELSEDDLRQSLEEITGFKKFWIGLIVKKLADIEGSGVNTNPRGSSTVVILTQKQNDYILALNTNSERIKQNGNKLQQAIEEVHTNSKNMQSNINIYYEKISQILTQQQENTLSKLETIKNSKLSLLKKASVEAQEATQFLQKSHTDFNRIINDKKLDMTQKQVAITQHIQSAQSGLSNYKIYLEHDMSLPTQPKMEYEANAETFQQFVQKMDTILDSDISFTEIKFEQHQANIVWKSDLIKLQKNAKFELQFKQYLLSTDDGKNQRWKVLEILEPDQTEINLSLQDNDDEKDDYKMDELYEDEIDDTEIMKKGRAGLLIGLTTYQFRVCVKTSHNIYSNVLTTKTPQFKRLKSTILNVSQEIQLMKWISNSSRCAFELLYRASRDGYTSVAFHQKCDNKGPAITIIKSNYDHIFGGYAEASFKSTNTYEADSNAWLYLLHSLNGGHATKLNVKQNNAQYALYNHTSYGPYYGSSSDLRISNNCNSSNSTTSLGNGYDATVNSIKFAGASSFTVKDYEVYAVHDPEFYKLSRSIILNDSQSKQIMSWITKDLSDIKAYVEIKNQKKNSGIFSFGKSQKNQSDEKEEQKEIEKPMTANECKFTLLYRASRDGYTSSVFHQRCNNKGTNISIIKSNYGNVFGGFTNKSWNSNNAYLRDDNAWLYSLKDAQRFKVKNGQNAVYGSSSHGPYYGNSPNLYIVNNANSAASKCNSGGAYGKINTKQFAGSSSFTVSDYEVWTIDYPPEPARNKIKSTILSTSERKQIMKWIHESNKCKFRLLFRASRDGYESLIFHKKCDNKEATITIMRSDNNSVFGGYTEESWNQTNQYAHDSDAWLYSVRSTQGYGAKKFPATNGTNAIYGSTSYGPYYGSNPALYISNNCNQTSSYCNLGSPYTGYSHQYQLSGKNAFTITDYEVFEVLRATQPTVQLKSTIITKKEFITLNGWVKKKNSSYKLLFRASRDGFRATTFHQKCDGKGKTLVIVRSTSNHVFGGYTEKSWKQVSGDYEADPKAWIYLLRSSRGDKPEKWVPTKRPSEAMFPYNGYGPAFGGGHDWYLSDSCNNNNSSYSNLGYSYSAPQDKNKLAGSYNFKVTDYEVWKIY